MASLRDCEKDSEAVWRQHPQQNHIIILHSAVNPQGHHTWQEYLLAVCVATELALCKTTALRKVGHFLVSGLSDSLCY